MQDGLEQVILIVGLERRLAGHHLVHQHPEGPPVHRGPVFQLLQDLNNTSSTALEQGEEEERVCNHLDTSGNRNVPRVLESSSL